MNKVTEPKKGGMGLRRLEEVNLALLMKLVYWLLSDKGKFCEFLNEII